MHELAIIEGILETINEIASSHGFTRISQVDLVIGNMHQLVPEMLEFSFETGTLGTKAENCKLIIEWRPVVVTCLVCRKQSGIKDNIFLCRHCGSFRLHVESGKELYIKSLTGE